MTPQMVVDIMQASFRCALSLALPILLSALIVGVLVSIFQAVTSIQEQTMAFVPKMIAVMIALIVLFSWMLQTIMEFTAGLFRSIPTFIR
ncbi:MAG: flagellar biosynthesis protein FliQ [Candidatus Sumerlaeota bacterium]